VLGFLIEGNSPWVTKLFLQEEKKQLKISDFKFQEVCDAAIFDEN